jgi:hypothetical protein
MMDTTGRNGEMGDGRVSLQIDREGLSALRRAFNASPPKPSDAGHLTWNALLDGQHIIITLKPNDRQVFKPYRRAARKAS